MEIFERLDIFKSTGQLSEEGFDRLTNVIKMFDKSLGIALTEENGAMLVTHLCVAYERISRHEAIDAIDKEIYDEIENNKNFYKAELAFTLVQSELGMQIPDYEKGYIMVHLCTLFERE